MKRSDKATPYLLIRAQSNSEWDNCEFAIVHLSEEWQKEQAKRLEAVKPFAGDYTFSSVSYHDAAVDFYCTGGDDQPETETLLAGKTWAFVELDEGEADTFSIPENRMDCYMLVLHSDGMACYKAYGKNTGEEFWTEEFLLTPLIQQ